MKISYKVLIKKTKYLCFIANTDNVKVAFSGLRQFFATESPLKMIKNAFYFLLKALFVRKIVKFLSRLFGHLEKRLC